MRSLSERIESTRYVLLIIAALTLTFYWNPLFDKDAGIHWDAVDVHYSCQKYFSDSILLGNLPFWTPYVYSGMPFLADPQTGAWYPLNWPFFLAGITPRAIEWELALHAFLACAGAFLLARDLLKCAGMSRATWPALFAAIVYGFSGFFSAHASHLGMFQTAALLPWLLWTADRAISGRSSSWMIGCGLVGGSLVLAGHFQTALYSFLALAVFAIARAISIKPRPITAALATLAIAGTVATLLSAIQSLPGLELTKNSIRSVDNYSAQTNAPLVAGALATLVSPNHYGALTSSYKGPGDVTQFYFYGGLLLVPFALAGFANRRLLPVIVAMMCVPLWYAFGPKTGLYDVIAALPGFRSVRAPVHIWFAVALALSVAAAAGLAYVASRWNRPWLAIAAVALTFVDLHVSNMDRNPMAYERASFDQRYQPFYDQFVRTAEAARTEMPRWWAPVDSAAFGPLNSTLDAHLEVTWGYNPLQLLRYADFLSIAQSNPKLLDDLSATARLDSRGLFQPAATALPRANFPASVRTVGEPDEKNALTTLDPAKEAVVSNKIEIRQDPAATVQVTGYTGDSYRFHYRAASSSLMRLAVPYFPGWEAKGDGGRSLQLIPVDHALTGVVVPAGKGDIEVAYHPTWFWLGAAISVFTLLGCAGALWFLSSRKSSADSTMATATLSATSN